MKQLIILVGPPGSGKSTIAKTEFVHCEYINQDSQGKENHLKLFKQALIQEKNIVVDRMGFSKEQRSRYIAPAKELGYTVSIIVLHENYETCLRRCVERHEHETIKTETDAKNALNGFFTKYERPTNDEGDSVIFRYPNGYKHNVIISDLDGTLANINHRLHFVKSEGKKNWKAFFDAIPNDKVNIPVFDILDKFWNHEHDSKHVIFCSGRPDNYRKQTEEWLKDHFDTFFVKKNYEVYMRPRNDFRRDDIVKEILLDFEILTRYTPYMIFDDRDQVIKMWRRRGFTCLQVQDGNF